MGSMKFLLAFAIGSASLAGSAFAADPAPTTPAASDANKVICKKTLETGSLVRKTKQCFTKAEWDMIAEVQRRGNEKMVDGLSTRPSGQ